MDTWSRHSFFGKNLHIFIYCNTRNFSHKEGRTDTEIRTTQSIRALGENYKENILSCSLPPPPHDTRYTAIHASHTRLLPKTNSSKRMHEMTNGC